MDIDWREHQRWVAVAGRDVNVIDIGDGAAEPLVFVHGRSGSWQNWLENIPHFAATRRVIAFDLPGFGYSPMPAGEITIPGYGAIVAELLGALEIGASHVVGNSMGGFIAAELAIQVPQHVERLALVSAAGLTIEHMRSEPGMFALRTGEALIAHSAAWVGKRSERICRRPGGRKLAFGMVAAHPARLPAALVAEQLRGSGKPGFVPAIDALTSYPIRHRLPEIACPTLIVWGAEDRLVPVRDAYEFERLIPDARALVWQDTGHVPMLERPARFNSELETFLG
jgi:pimeloyl-ACP methyl ester carboxylesterase